jgi:hypothetical protein
MSGHFVGVISSGQSSTDVEETGGSRYRAQVVHGADRELFWARAV